MAGHCSACRSGPGRRRVASAGGPATQPETDPGAVSSPQWTRYSLVLGDGTSLPPLVDPAENAVSANNTKPLTADPQR